MEMAKNDRRVAPPSPGARASVPSARYSVSFLVSCRSRGWRRGEGDGTFGVFFGAEWVGAGGGREVGRDPELFTHPDLLEGVSFPGRLSQERDEVGAVALRLQVAHQPRCLLHLLGG